MKLRPGRDAIDEELEIYMNENDELLDEYDLTNDKLNSIEVQDLQKCLFIIGACVIILFFL